MDCWNQTTPTTWLINGPLVSKRVCGLWRDCWYLNSHKGWVVYQWKWTAGVCSQWPFSLTNTVNSREKRIDFPWQLSVLFLDLKKVCICFYNNLHAYTHTHVGLCLRLSCSWNTMDCSNSQYITRSMKIKWHEKLHFLTLCIHLSLFVLCFQPPNNTESESRPRNNP